MPIVPYQIERISREVASGKKLRTAISEEGITPLEFFKHLDQNPEDKLLFERSRQIALEMLLDDSQGLLENIGDKMDLEVAKATIAHRTWLAEKLIPATYGAKITHDVNQTINITHILAEANNRVANAIPATSRPVVALDDRSKERVAEIENLEQIEKDLIGE